MDSSSIRRGVLTLEFGEVFSIRNLVFWALMVKSLFLYHSRKGIILIERLMDRLL